MRPSVWYGSDRLGARRITSFNTQMACNSEHEQSGKENGIQSIEIKGQTCKLKR